MFSWQLFINDALRLAVLTGVALIVVYMFSVLTGQATLTWLSVAICVVTPILMGVAIAGQLAYYQFVERGRPKFFPSAFAGAAVAPNRCIDCDFVWVVTMCRSILHCLNAPNPETRFGVFRM